MAYIEREKAKELIKNFGKGAIKDGQYALDAVDDIILLASAVDLIPTVDAVEVVRCFECRNCEVVNNDITYAICKAPPKTLFLPFDIDTRTHFCSYGERRESQDAGT